MKKTLTEYDYYKKCKGKEFKQLEKIIRKGFIDEILYGRLRSLDEVSVYLNLFKRELIIHEDDKFKTIIDGYVETMTKTTLAYIVLKPEVGITKYDDYKVIIHKIANFTDNGFDYKSEDIIYDNIISLETIDCLLDQYVAKYWYEKSPETYNKYLPKNVQFYFD